MNQWTQVSARRAAWPRPAWRSDHITGLIIFVSGCVTMIAAGVFLILMGPQG